MDYNSWCQCKTDNLKVLRFSQQMFLNDHTSRHSINKSNPIDEENQVSHPNSNNPNQSRGGKGNSQCFHKRYRRCSSVPESKVQWLWSLDNEIHPPVSLFKNRTQRVVFVSTDYCFYLTFWQFFFLPLAMTFLAPSQLSLAFFMSEYMMSKSKYFSDFFFSNSNSTILIPSTALFNADPFLQTHMKKNILTSIF